MYSHWNGSKYNWKEKDNFIIHYDKKWYMSNIDSHHYFIFFFTCLNIFIIILGDFEQSCVVLK